MRAKADYLAKIGDKGAAVKAYAATESKSAGSGPKLDLVFSLLRYAFHINCFWIQRYRTRQQYARMRRSA